MLLYRNLKSIFHKLAIWAHSALIIIITITLDSLPSKTYRTGMIFYFAIFLILVFDSLARKPNLEKIGKIGSDLGTLYPSWISLLRYVPGGYWVSWCLASFLQIIPQKVSWCSASIGRIISLWVGWCLASYEHIISPWFSWCLASFGHIISPSVGWCLASFGHIILPSVGWCTK